MKWCYQVKLTRNVRSPTFGPHAYHTERRTHDFPFGKNQPHKTGKEALQAAEAFANANLDSSSSVSIWKLSGGAYGWGGGSGRYIKDDKDCLFDDGCAGLDLELQMGGE